VTEVLLNLTEVFLTLTEVFPCFFLSRKANARVKLAKTRHGPHSTTLVVFVLFSCYLCCSMYCLCVNVHCHRVTTQLQLINIPIANNQLDVQFFFMYVCFYSLHVSGSHVPIIRRINCINTTSGIYHSVKMSY